MKREEKKDKKRKKKENPHRRPFSIEIIENQNKPILYKVATDIGFRTGGITFLNIESGEIKCINYKKNTNCKVQGMKIVDLLNLCKETIRTYLSLLPLEIKNHLDQTQFIFEEPLLIANQRSFSISLYIFLSQLIEYYIKELHVHSICLVIPGSAKKLIGFSPGEHMPDSIKTQFIKEHLPSANCPNNHCADSVFSIILTNQQLLKELYPELKILKEVSYEIYKSQLV